MTTDSGAEVGPLQNSDCGSEAKARDGPLDTEQRGSHREGRLPGAEQHQANPSAQGKTRVPPKFPPMAIRTGPSVLHPAKICCPPPVFIWTSFETAPAGASVSGLEILFRDFPYP